MEKEEIVIVDNKLILPKRLLRALKWRFPFYRIPELEEYSPNIIEASKKNKQLPYYIQFDINNDGKDEVLLIQKSIFDKIGRLIIISEKSGKYKIDKIKWIRPANALFPDYFLDIAQPQEYQAYRMDSNSTTVKYNHLIAKGYLGRIVYWDGLKYCQKRI